MPDSFSEEFDCGWCEREVVFTVSTEEFNQTGDNTGAWGWSPKFSIVKRKCPFCGEESEFGLGWEKCRGAGQYQGGYFLIYEID